MPAMTQSRGKRLSRPTSLTLLPLTAPPSGTVATTMQALPPPKVATCLRVGCSISTTSWLTKSSPTSTVRVTPASLYAAS